MKSVLEPEGNIWWEGFVEHVGVKLGVKEWGSYEWYMVEKEQKKRMWRAQMEESQSWKDWD